MGEEGLAQGKDLVAHLCACQLGSKAQKTLGWKSIRGPALPEPQVPRSHKGPYSPMGTPGFCHPVPVQLPAHWAQ